MSISRLKQRRVRLPVTVVYWACLMGLGLVSLAMFRGLFLIRHWDLARHTPAAALARAFLVGARFDLVVISALVLPFILLGMVPQFHFSNARVGRRFLQPIMFTVFGAAYLLCLIDIEYFGVFREHLGVWFYTYLDQFGVVLYTIANTYPVLPYLGFWLVVTVVFIFLALKLNRLFAHGKEPLLTRVGYSVAILALLTVALRGSISLAALDWGIAYHSNYYFANELALNGAFTLGKSLYEQHDDLTRHNPVKYRFFASDEALRTVQSYVTQPGDSLLEPENSLVRVSKTSANAVRRDNVVIIFLESWSTKYIGSLGGNPTVTPFFDSLADGGVLFENFYASGMRTNRGLLSVLCSFPSEPGRTVMKRYGAPQPFTCIAEMLAENGYERFLLYGGDPGFDNIGGFFRNRGFNHLTSIGDFPRSASLNKWGVPDHLVFEKANAMFSGAGAPFLGVVVTQSNHEPHTVPDSSFALFGPQVRDHRYLNSFYYSDWALRHFFELAREEEYFDSTIFVLVADHSRNLASNDVTQSFHIPCLIYCPGRPDVGPRRVATTCSQVDVMPTLFGLLGGTWTHSSWGRDLLAESASEGYAFVNHGDICGWVEDTLVYWGKVGSYEYFQQHGNKDISDVPVTTATSGVFERMQKAAKSYLQVEVEMVHEGRTSAYAIAAKKEN